MHCLSLPIEWVRLAVIFVFFAQEAFSDNLGFSTVSVPVSLLPKETPGIANHPTSRVLSNGRFNSNSANEPSIPNGPSLRFTSPKPAQPVFFKEGVKAKRTSPGPPAQPPPGYCPQHLSQLRTYPNSALIPAGCPAPQLCSSGCDECRTTLRRPLAPKSNSEEVSRAEPSEFASFDEFWAVNLRDVSTFVLPKSFDGSPRGYDRGLFRDNNYSGAGFTTRSPRRVAKMAVEDLRGCTSVVVVSKRGFWISHLFESPGFIHVVEDNNGDLSAQHNEKTFYYYIRRPAFEFKIREFRFNDGLLWQSEPLMVYLDLLTSVGENAKVFIFTPESVANPGTPFHSDGIRSIEEWMGYHGLGNNFRYYYHDYPGVSDARKGGVLVQYFRFYRSRNDQSYSAIKVYQYGVPEPVYHEEWIDDFTEDERNDQRQRDIIRVLAVRKQARERGLPYENIGWLDSENL